MNSDLEERLHNLGNLEDGWLDGTGKAADKNSIEMARTWITNLIEAGFERPRMCLDDEGIVYADGDLKGEKGYILEFSDNRLEFLVCESGGILNTGYFESLEDMIKELRRHV